MKKYICTGFLECQSETCPHYSMHDFVSRIFGECPNKAYCRAEGIEKVVWCIEIYDGWLFVDKKEPIH